MNNNIVLDIHQFGAFYFCSSADGSRYNLAIFPQSIDKPRCCACGEILPQYRTNDFWEAEGLHYSYEGAHLQWVCCNEICRENLSSFLFEYIDWKERDDYFDRLIEIYWIAEKRQPELNKHNDATKDIGGWLLLD